ncbi:MAG: hypothetical protein Q4G14_14705 [Paracoccus sp. (in: a-proteobacteria)]|uniref:hypothetical protein n=1 Tax=Paracoccus sp. TaxID=267 RepID=UPI0026E01664|nr:hypothetical protein [Paracoccus sp. (in: a-proteobacteria)]MDO5614477.1 hypothetical protein [Paracoccus sp. (in: a-proteobacteria)]
MQNPAPFPAEGKKDFVPSSVEVRFNLCPNQITTEAKPFRVSVKGTRFQAINLIVASLVYEKRVVVRQCGPVENEAFEYARFSFPYKIVGVTRIAGQTE